MGDKLQPRFTGPFLVAEVLGGGVYRMEKEDGVAIKQTVTSSRGSNQSARPHRQESDTGRHRRHRTRRQPGNSEADADTCQRQFCAHFL